MKKTFFFFVTCLVGFFSVSAQNYNALLLDYSTGKFEEAKKELDKLMTDPKAEDKPETYLWELKVNSELFGDSILHDKYPGVGDSAVIALNKYVAKEPDLKMLKESGLRAVSLLYGQSFNYGRDNFQAKDWNKAFDNFKRGQEISEFIGKNELNTNGKYTIDTVVVLYTAYAAQNAGKGEEAVKRYRALGDWKVNDKDYEDIYKYTIDYDTRQKDEANFKKDLAVAKELYPGDMATWNQMEMNYMSSNSGLKEMIAKYKADDASGKLKGADYITFGETFATPDKTQLDALDSAEQDDLKRLSADAFIKAYNSDKNGLYAFNAGVLYYNIFGELDDRFFGFRGESPDLKLKREEVLKQQQDVAVKAIEWLEKSYTDLKARDTLDKNESNSLNRAVDYLANLYLWKRDKSRGTDTKEYDAFDTKYKLYDSEHDKYRQ